MSSVLFFIAAIGVISGAVGVVVLRNPFYSVLALVVHLIALAAELEDLDVDLGVRGGVMLGQIEGALE